MSSVRKNEGQSRNPEAERVPRHLIVSEARDDPYRLARGYPEATLCPACGAVFHDGRWQWARGAVPVVAGAPETECPACRRINDGYPAGSLSIAGAFLARHRDDVLAALRAEERLERDEHPLHRIATLTEGDNEIVVTTTDIHLPRRIAEALYDAYEGIVNVDYGEDDQSVRVTWRRDDPHPPAVRARAPLLPFEILDNGVLVTPEANAYLHERLERLRRFYPRILSCRVVLDAPEGHHRKGGPYDVNVHVDIPGDVARVTRQHAGNLHVAIGHAFDAVQRQLEDRIRKQRGEVSPTVAPARAHVARLFLEPGYGFLTAEDGHEVYFHRNSVLGTPFERLQVGDEVRFAEEPGDEGPQASTVEA